MKLLHAGMQGSCEFIIDDRLALIRYKGWITPQFLRDCLKEKQALGTFKDINFFVIDFRPVSMMLSRGEVEILSAELRQILSAGTIITFLADKPLETAIAFLFCQGLETFQTQVFTGPEPAIASYIRMKGSDCLSEHTRRQILKI